MTTTPHPVRVWTGSGWQDLALVGPPGPPGTGTGTGDKNYHHPQGTAAATWGPIPHMLGKVPAVTVVNSAHEVVEGEMEIVDNDHVTLNFGAAFAGDAYFN